MKYKVLSYKEFDELRFSVKYAGVWGGLHVTYIGTWNMYIQFEHCYIEVRFEDIIETISPQIPDGFHGKGL